MLKTDLLGFTCACHQLPLTPDKAELWHSTSRRLGTPFCVSTWDRSTRVTRHTVIQRVHHSRDSIESCRPNAGIGHDLCVIKGKTRGILCTLAQTYLNTAPNPTNPNFSNLFQLIPLYFSQMIV